MKTKFRTPSLDIDKVLYKNQPMRIENKLERRVIANLLNEVIKSGFVITGIWDGEEFTKTSGIKDSMEILFNLDEAHIYIKSSLDKEHYIYVIFGNSDVIDIVSDWSFLEGDKDGFDKFMEGFDAEKYI